MLRNEQGCIIPPILQTSPRTVRRFSERTFLGWTALRKRSLQAVFKLHERQSKSSHITLQPTTERNETTAPARKSPESRGKRLCSNTACILQPTLQKGILPVGKKDHVPPELFFRWIAPSSCSNWSIVSGALPCSRLAGLGPQRHMRHR